MTRLSAVRLSCLVLILDGAALPALLLLCLFLSGTAHAVLGGYYSVAGKPERWSDITKGANAKDLYLVPTIPGNGASYLQTISLPFANGFGFDRNAYYSLDVASNGFASFHTITPTNNSNDETFPAATILAPWWGALGVCYDHASVSWATFGSEPDLTVIIQWSNLSYDHGGTNDCSGTDVGRDLFNFQMRLHESGQVAGVQQDGVIDFLYGDHLTSTSTINCIGNYSSGNVLWCLPTDFPGQPCGSTSSFCLFYGPNTCLFASGLEDDTGSSPSGMVAQACGAACAHDVFPLSGTLNRFTNGPDLQIGLVDVLGQFSPGLAMTATVQVANVAPNPVASKSTGAETIDLFLSPDGVAQRGSSWGPRLPYRRLPPGTR
jgi:hypothetical protein